MFGKKGIQLDPALMEKVRAAAAKAGYASPDEFVAHVLEKELSRSDDASSDADVKKKLEGLGYIS
jgi:metal-responsive CopG/Arc/MetJ family transcriptional regulator